MRAASVSRAPRRAAYRDESLCRVHVEATVIRSYSDTLSSFIRSVSFGSFHAFEWGQPRREAIRRWFSVFGSFIP